MDINHIIAEYGAWFYPITFAWTFLEGETFVIFAGAAAQQELLNFQLLIVAAWAGSFTGDQLYFFIGRMWGQKLLGRFPRYRPPVDIALGFLRKYNVWFILSFRFIYGIRNVSSFAMGMSGLSWTRFLVLNFIAAGVWSLTFAGAGFLLGAAFSAMLGRLAEGFALIMMAIFLVVISGVVLMHKRLQRREAELLAKKLAEEREKAKTGA
ncbi:MAG: DedA family protein [Alphaproteobacteria bacterium]|nr:DedA family protein [Alphaproteobacteria bacterium]